MKSAASKSAVKKPDNPAEQAMEKLSNQLSCSVCLEEYRRPRVLPCLHVFCEACLEKLVGAQRDKLRALCPNCRKPAPLPEGGVSGLPSAFYIQHLFEVREALEKVRNPKKAQCDKCGEGEVQGFCRDCGQFICQLCSDMHRKWKELQGHEISSLDEVQETASKMVTPKKVTTLCTKHPTEPIKIYCETCDELICRDCTVKAHRDHNYNLIPDAFPKHRDAILACLGPVKTELAGVDQTITELKARSSRLDGQGVEAKGKVDAEVDKLHAILEAHRGDLHSEISVDRKGSVLVADYINYRIQVFDTNGRYLSSITYTTPGQRLQGPASVAVGPDDWVYVVEFGCARVSVFDKNGKYIKSFGKRGDKDGEFKDPYAIVVSDDGRVFVSDTGNNRVQVFK